MSEYDSFVKRVLVVKWETAQRDSVFCMSEIADILGLDLETILADDDFCDFGDFLVAVAPDMFESPSALVWGDMNVSYASPVMYPMFAKAICPEFEHWMAICEEYGESENKDWYEREKDRFISGSIVLN